jgi:hypothetical protein
MAYQSVSRSTAGSFKKGLLCGINFCPQRQLDNITRSQYMYSFIHSAVCLTTGPLPLPKRVLHRVRSSASSFNFPYLLFSSGHTVAAYAFFLVFPSFLSFLLTFLQSRVHVLLLF